MGVYIPPSIRTVREDISSSVVISGGQVIPALIGTASGRTSTVAAYEAELGTTDEFTFPALGDLGPPLSVSEIRTKPSGGLVYVQDVDYTYNPTTKIIDWGASTPLIQPYLLTITALSGTSTLVNGTTYYFVVTARKTTDLTGPVVGETIASNETSFTPTASNIQAVLAWTAVAGAEGYRVYRTTTQGDYTGAKLVATISGGYSTTYTDTGTATSTGSPPGVATSAQVTAANSAPYNLEPAQTLIATVNGGGPFTATFSATRAAKTGVGAVYPTGYVGSETLLLTVDGGAVQTITFTNGDQTLADVVNRINASITGGFADTNGGQLRISSDKRGLASTIAITGGSGITALGLTVSSTSGTGNVQDIDAVTAAEVASIAQTAFTGTTGTVPAGFPVITNNTSGTSGTLQITGGTANSTIGFPTSLVTGSNPPPATALRRPALHGEPFYVDYQYTQNFHFTTRKYTNLGLLITDYGLGSNMAIAATLAMAGSGRGNGASIVLAMSIPDDNLFTYQTAFDFLALRKDVDLVVPLAVTSGLNNALKSHCDTQSDVDHKRERLGIVGTAIGVQPGDEDTSGTAIYMARQLNDRRMSLVYPWPFVDVQTSDGTIVNTEMNGWAGAAAYAGMIASLPDRAEPPTTKQIQGITALGLQLDETTENLLGAAGVMVITEENGNFICRDAITTSLDNEADIQQNINLTDDFLRKTLRAQFAQFRGRKLLPTLLDQIEKRTAKVLALFVKLQLIAGFDASTITAVQDPDQLTYIIVRFSYRPIFPARVIEFRYSFDLRTSALAA